MRTITEYLAKAEEFEHMAKTSPARELKQRYADIAESYRIMASERRRLIAQGLVKPDPEKNGLH